MAIIIDNKVANGETMLFRSLHDNATSFSRTLLENGANPMVECHGDYPIEEALRNDNLEMVKLLLSKGAEPNKVNVKGTGHTTSVEIAVYHQEHKILEVLLENGGSLNYLSESVDNLIEHINTPGLRDVVEKYKDSFSKEGKEIWLKATVEKLL